MIDNGGVLAAAGAFLAEQVRRGVRDPHAPAAVGGVRLRHVDEDFCVEVADHFHGAPRRERHAAVERGYAVLKSESRRQFELLREFGLRVEPWLSEGQPYRGYRELAAGLAGSGMLYVYLTRAGHGPGSPAPDHPMCEPAGIRIRGVDLLYNDLFRAVHDIFGHVVYAAPMSPAGELLASYGHMSMYSRPAHPVLFSEQVSQVCWFFYGPHLRDAAGRLPRPGEAGWVAPARRPYPEQKVFRCPPGFLTRFAAGFAAGFQEASP